MNLAHGIAPAAVAPAALHWPRPPFFRLEGELSGAPCVVECLDGTALHGELAAFDLRRETLTARMRGREQVLPFSAVRLLCLVQPLALVRDEALLRRLGARESRAGADRPFEIRFRQGPPLKGTTRGFSRHAAGVFLYPLHEGSNYATAWFIPAAQVADLRVGLPLGEMLKQRGAISDRKLQAALEAQAALRTRRLGEQLAAEGIVTPADLRAALAQAPAHAPIRLGEFLVREGLVTAEQLDAALRTQSSNRARRLGDILVEMRAVTLRGLQLALSQKLGIPCVNVRTFVLDPEVLALVDARMAFRCQALPLLETDDALVVAVADPLGTDYLQELRFATNRTIVPVIAEPDALQRRIAVEYAGGRPAASAPRPEPPKPRASEPAAPERAEYDALNDNALVRLAQRMIIDAHAQGASDIHIESNPLGATSKIRFRKDGDLEDYQELPTALRNALVSRIKIMAGLDISEHRRAQDGKIDFKRFGPLAIELRVAIVPTTNGLEDVVMRILSGIEPVPVEKLGFGGRDLREVKAMVERSYGLILVCGPTGSGKTTTLHSLLHHINRPDTKIWTAEDPVEITQPGLRQVQVNAKIGWTFADAMRAFLRADPDVIMVGEMRDQETASIGVEASLTGHLVMSTLHTNSAAESVTRLLELGLDPFNFADALLGVLSQRLGRKLCADCRIERPASPAELEGLAREYCEGTELDPSAKVAEWQGAHGHDGAVLLHEAVGCDHCRKGYRGRVGIYELLVADAAVKEAVRQRAPLPQIVRAALAGGMRTLRQDAIEKALAGLIDLNTARAAAS